jgi:hypothetical protein
MKTHNVRNFKFAPEKVTFIDVEKYPDTLTPAPIEIIFYP